MIPGYPPTIGVSRSRLPDTNRSNASLTLMVFFEYNTITMKRKLLSLYNYDSQMRYYTRWHSCYPESPDCDQTSAVDLSLIANSHLESGVETQVGVGDWKFHVSKVRKLKKSKPQHLNFIKHQKLLKNSSWGQSYVDLKKVPIFFCKNVKYPWNPCWPKIWQW